MPLYTCAMTDRVVGPLPCHCGAPCRSQGTSMLMDRHPYVFEALCIRAEGIRINFVPNVFGDPMYSMSLYIIDGYSRSGCESLASHRNYMCLSLSMLLLVIVLLLTCIPQNLPQLNKNGSYSIEVSCVICSTLSDDAFCCRGSPSTTEVPPNSPWRVDLTTLE
jgi:hypothetical protein